MTRLVANDFTGDDDGLHFRRPDSFRVRLALGKGAHSGAHEKGDADDSV